MDITEEYNKRGWLEHMILCAVVDHSKKNSGVIDSSFGDRPLNLTMQLNDIVLDPLVYIRRLEEAYEEQVTSKAQEMVDELTNDALEPINDLLHNVSSSIRSIVKSKLGVKISDDDEYPTVILEDIISKLARIIKTEDIEKNLNRHEILAVYKIVSDHAS